MTGAEIVQRCVLSASHRVASGEGACAACIDAALKMQQQPDFTSAAAELARRIDEIKKSIATIEEAKVVTQHLLRKEVR